jgi:hypothetical protein
MENINKIIEQIAQTAFDNVPVESWNKIVIDVPILVTYVELTATYYIADVRGKSFDADYPDAPRDKSMISLFEQLRKEMYALTPGKGAWFDATMVITDKGEFNMTYNYDNKPKFEMTPDEEEYIIDTKEFPRDASSTPDWLAGILNKNGKGF